MDDLSITPSSLPLSPLSSELFHCIKNNLWNAALHKIASNPEDACYKCPEDGATALHIAVLHDAPQEVIRALLQANPSALAEQDFAGCTPLHDCCHRASDKTLRTLLQFASSSVPSWNIRDNSNLTPLQYLATVWDELITSSIHKNRESVKPLELLTRDWILSRVWDKATSLIQAEYYNLARSQSLPKLFNHNIVSMCATIASTCPKSIFQLAVSFFPSQIAQSDSMGNLPLHRACTSTSETPIVELLVDMFPQAVSVENLHHQLPLHFACRSGLPWSSGVAALVQMFPNALWVPDGATKLYPFMAMICDDETSRSHHSRTNSDEHLLYERINSSIKLLLLCPELERLTFATENIIASKLLV
mmetsp:Transcript_13787/g.19759  ORF Transcript_13787/g.19759 Transcript_13787/m.19759 type:complete len:362 (-) Transcript_13787:48-1133(-)